MALARVTVATDYFLTNYDREFMRLYNKSAFARLAGTERTNVIKSCRGELADALSGDGKIDIEHPVARNYLARYGVTELPPLEPESGGNQQYNKGRPADADVGAVQSWDMQKLEHLTIKEVALRYGTIASFKQYVDSLKAIAEYQQRSLKVEASRNELISRDLVKSRILPVIELAFQRLVVDMPDALERPIIARVRSGGENVSNDVSAMIRDRVSGILKDLQKSLKDRDFAS